MRLGRFAITYKNVMIIFVAGSIRTSPLTSKATDHSIAHEIKEWLKFASERDGAKKLRELKKRRVRDQSGRKQQQ